MSESCGQLAPAARTYLFVPGDRPDRFDKAWQSAADEIVIDLEDAVAPDRKDEARRAVGEWLRPEQPVWIRCNAPDTPWFQADLALAGYRGLRGLVVPKAEVLPASLIAASARSGALLMPLVETAAGIASVEALAWSPGVARLAFGSIDFQLDLGIEGEGEELLMFRSRLVLASRLAGLPAPVDGVTVEVDDAERIRADTRRGSRLGMGAKLCIHPRQVAAVHEALQPTDSDRAWAARVVAAFEAAGGAAVSVDGKMVDRPVLLKALRIRSNAGAATTSRRRCPSGIAYLDRERCWTSDATD